MQSQERKHARTATGVDRCKPSLTLTSVNMSSCCPGCGKWYPKRPRWHLRQYFLTVAKTSDQAKGNELFSRKAHGSQNYYAERWTYLGLQMCAPQVASLADVLPGVEVAALLVLRRACPAMLSWMWESKGLALKRYGIPGTNPQPQLAHPSADRRTDLAIRMLSKLSGRQQSPTLQSNSKHKYE